MEYHGILLGMGNPLLDMSATVDEKFLKKYEELAKNYNVEYIPGGATQNSIRVAQWLLPYPGATSYIGCIGNDKFGEEMKKSAKRSGIDAYYYEDKTTPTGTCAVIYFGGERSLIANLSAANCFKAEHLKHPEIWARVEKAKYFYVAGFFLTVSLESIKVLAKNAAANNKIFTMDLSAPFICEFYKDEQDQIIPYIDYVFGNEVEARTFSKVHGWKTDDVEEIAIKISQLPKANGARKRIVVFIQGPVLPVLVAEDGKIKLFPFVPLPKHKIVDTNGVADAFIGGFLSQLIQEKDIEECVRIGCDAALAMLQRPGCSCPTQPHFS
uniref:Adenosine kinase n=1 Tax=Cajanus cajan TaxID=3821 RepID=A0A151SE14_CAJCA|nr:Adenosine kinase 2 [Cajanus cajan]